MTCSGCALLTQRIEALEKHVKEVDRQLIALRWDVSDTVVVDGDDVCGMEDSIGAQAERLTNVVRSLGREGYLHVIVFTTQDLAPELQRYDVRPNEIMWKQMTDYSCKDLVVRAARYNCPFLTSVEVDSLHDCEDVPLTIRHWLYKNQSSMHLKVSWDHSGRFAKIVLAFESGNFAAEPRAAESAMVPEDLISQPPPKSVPPQPPQGLEIETELPRTILITETEDYSVQLVEHKGHHLVCFLLERDAVSCTLAQGSSEISVNILGESNLEEDEIEEVPNLYSSEHWVETHQIVTATTGKFSGLQAIGLGSNAKVRKRAARLAVSIAALCSESCPRQLEVNAGSEIMTIVTQIRLVLGRGSETVITNNTLDTSNSRVAITTLPFPTQRPPAPPPRAPRAPPPAAPGSGGAPPPPPGRPPLHAFIGPQAPPHVLGSPPSMRSSQACSVKPLQSQSPPSVMPKETVQPRPQPSAWTQATQSASLGPLPDLLRVPPPPPQASGNASALTSQNQSASAWLDSSSTADMEDSVATWSEANASEVMSARAVPPPRPVPSSQIVEVVPTQRGDWHITSQGELPLDAERLNGKRVIVLSRFSSENAGYLVCERGDYVEIQCDKAEQGEDNDPFAYYIYGKKVNGVGKGWLPYCKDVIRVL